MQFGPVLALKHLVEECVAAYPCARAAALPTLDSQVLTPHHLHTTQPPVLPHSTSTSKSSKSNGRLPSSNGDLSTQQTAATRGSSSRAEGEGEGAVQGSQATAEAIKVGSETFTTEALAWYIAACFEPVPQSDMLQALSDGPPGMTAAQHAAWAKPCSWAINAVAAKENGAQRSLMHRFNAAADLVGQVAKVGDAGERASALSVVVAWLRMYAARGLIWNRNYNVKPREISAAQDAACGALAALYENAAGEERSLVRAALAAIGRGGAGDVGQRVRDEILDVQQR